MAVGQDMRPSGKRRLKIGIQLSNTEPWDVVLATAQRAASVGFDSLWLSDHLYMKREHMRAAAPPIYRVPSRPLRSAVSKRSGRCWKSWTVGSPRHVTGG